LLGGEQIEEASQPQRDSGRIRRDPELVEYETIGSSYADVASVNALQEVQRDEMVLDLPKEVGQKDYKCESNAEPKPRAAEITSRRCKKQAGDNPHNQKHHGVLREHAQTDRSPDGQAPARIV